MLEADRGTIKLPFAMLMSHLIHPIVNVLKLKIGSMVFKYQIFVRRIQCEHKDKGQNKYILNFLKCFRATLVD